MEESLLFATFEGACSKARPPVRSGGISSNESSGVHGELKLELLEFLSPVSAVEDSSNNALRSFLLLDTSSIFSIDFRPSRK